MALHKGKSICNPGKHKSHFPLHLITKKENNSMLLRYRSLKAKELPPERRRDVHRALSLNHMVLIQLQGVAFEGKREVNKEELQKQVGRPKHSQKYAKPDPWDKQESIEPEAKARYLPGLGEQNLTAVYTHNCTPEKYLTSAAACPLTPGSQKQPQSRASGTPLGKWQRWGQARAVGGDPSWGWSEPLRPICAFRALLYRHKDHLRP